MTMRSKKRRKRKWWHRVKLHHLYLSVKNALKR
jgi:hypothetical protein